MAYLPSVSDNWIKYGYPSIQKFDDILKLKNITHTYKEISSFINGQETHQEHKQTQRKSYGHITSRAINEIWQADLIDYTKYGKFNKDYKWILLMIDVFSRKGYAMALKSKSADDVLDGLKKIFNSTSVLPKVFHTDNGKEFLNKKVSEYLKQKNVIHITNEINDHRALGIIDRFVKTIKTIIQKNFTYFENNEWLSRYKDIVISYNETPHNSLDKLTPNNVPKNIEFVGILNTEKIKNANMGVPHKVGDIVKLRIGVDQKFRKGYMPHWSKETYTIIDQKGKSYQVDDGTKKYHRHYDVIIV